MTSLIRDFYGGLESGLKNEEMQIMCVGEGYFMADVKDFSLIRSRENVHIIPRFCCFSDFFFTPLKKSHSYRLLENCLGHCLL